ncbi:toll/interleukin-1 receptor domain-containing protein [Methylolobus aquaticus]|nr:toll/interleukin-1 receptor domain-containing protein [Methylolobus aquaticus]
MVEGGHGFGVLNWLLRVESLEYQAKRHQTAAVWLSLGPPCGRYYNGRESRSESGGSVTGKVYVSYAWSVEREKQIVEKLEAACQSRGIDFHRDIKRIGYGESIREFMDQLAAGDHVVLVLSDAYFKSSDCMYELKGVYERSQDEKAFRQRVHPIVVEGTRFRKVRERTPYLRHWEDEVTATKNELETIDRTYTQESQRELDDYAEFRRLIDRLFTILGDMNTLTEGIHVDSDFAALLDRINPKAADARTDAVGARQRRKDSQFLNAQRQEIRALLDKHAALRQAVSAKAAEICGDQAVGDGLAQLCDQPLDIVVDDVFYPAVVDVLKGVDGNDFEPIWRDAKDILFRLLLFAVKTDWVETLEARGQPLDLCFEVAVQTPGGIELGSARFRQMVPELNAEPGVSDVLGNDAMRLPKLETGWNDDFAVETVLSEVWNWVFPGEKGARLSAANLQKLRSRLARHEKQRSRHLYLPVPADQDDPWMRRELYGKVLEKLPSLTIIYVRSAQGESVLRVSDEIDFMDSVLGFLEIPRTIRNQPRH